jgi:hypothetical protein
MKKILLILLMVLITTVGCFNIAPQAEAQKPAAHIDEITPVESSPGATVNFKGHGTDPENDIVAFRWRSNLDGELSTEQRFDTSSLSEGEHTIYFKVQNQRGTWSDEVTRRITVASAGGNGSPPPATSKPVISAFSATPGSIMEGGSSTLNWTVTGATEVSIDQGIGDVALSSSRPVSPASSTVYTLTAKNDAGTVKATAQVIVTSSSPSPAAGLPDLIIEDITRSGDTILYTIRNQGDGDAAATITELSIDGSIKANDPVDPIAAGDSREESFSYTYECSLPNDTITARADKDDVLTESNEANNELPETWSCILYVIPGPILTLVPDLVITDIWKVSEITGDKIYYKIKNQGLGSSIESTTSLNFYPAINPLPVATDDVPALAAGEEVTRKFATYNWPGWGSYCTVKADYNEAVGETDETNNSHMEPTGGL